MWCQVDMSSCHQIWLSSDSIQPSDSIFSGCVLLIPSAAAIWSPNNHHRGWRSLNTRTDIRWEMRPTKISWITFPISPLHSADWDQDYLLLSWISFENPIFSSLLTMLLSAHCTVRIVQISGTRRQDMSLINSLPRQTILYDYKILWTQSELSMNTYIGKYHLSHQRPSKLKIIQEQVADVKIFRECRHQFHFLIVTMFPPS